MKLWDVINVKKKKKNRENKKKKIDTINLKKNKYQ